MTKLKKKKKKELARSASEAVAEAAGSSLVDESVFKDSSAQTGLSDCQLILLSDLPANLG